MHLLIVSICYENIFSHLAKAWKESSKSLGPCIEFVTHWCYYWALWVCNWPDSCAGHFFATQPAVMPSSSLYRMCFVRWGLIDSEWIMHYKWANTSLSLVPVFWSVYVRCFFISRITLPFSDFFFFFLYSSIWYPSWVFMAEQELPKWFITEDMTRVTPDPRR